MNIKQLNEFPICEFLERERILPIKIRGSAWWYFSPIREKERTPSFKVDVKINRWYDHGIGEGGKLFDLALKLYKETDEKEVIKALSYYYALPRKSFPSVSTFAEPRTITVEQVNPLGSHKTLVHYLSARGIDFNTAVPYCKDIHFKIKDKFYYAIGFKNQSGGYELRNSFFKGSSSPKDMTLIKNASDSICVTEGFMDFLSLLQLRLPQTNSNFLILNSLSFVRKSVPILKEHKNINLFLNNDKSGVTATNFIIQNIGSVKDHSLLYQGQNDLNDYLVKRNRTSNDKIEEKYKKKPQIKFRV
jgi:hypothetical protein